MSDSLDDTFTNFQNPPDATRPRTWWHWTGGNVTLDGINKDLEWMHRAGIAGFQLADVAFGSGQTVDDKILFGTPEWLAAVRFVAQEAARLNLEMAIFSSAGWSLTGGPWVKPEQAMKKNVWSDTLVHASHTFSGKLPHPPFNNGPIQNLGGGSRSNQNPHPYGEFLVAVAAEPVYQLLGKTGLNTDKLPPAGESILHDIGFIMHDGGHGMVPSDWDVIFDFLHQHMQPGN